MDRQNSTLSFSEGQKLLMPRVFATMVKPIGSVCNMRCVYCYYLGKDNRGVMSEELLHRYIRDYIEGCEGEVVNFCWHGGEPLLAGLEFYQKAMVYQKYYAIQHKKKIENTLQTNGLLVDEKWCQFFVENNFLVGVSIDGPQDIHDAFRVDAKGEKTFSRVIKAVELFKSCGVEFNTLSVVNSLCVGRGGEVYEFFKELGSHYMQFLPAVEFVGEGGEILSPLHSASGSVSEWSIGGKEYGEFMVDIFELWRKKDIGNYFVQLFDATLVNWYGMPAGVCSMRQSCGDALLVEYNGDVYSCDHFVYLENLLGNLKNTTLGRMYRSSQQFEFGVKKRSALPVECARCQYYFACTGGCPKHRFYDSGGGLDTAIAKNYLCDGFKLFFGHVSPYMSRMVELLNNEQSPSQVMREFL